MKRLLMRILLVAGMATSLLTLSAVSIDDWDSTDWTTKVTQFNSTPVANVSGVNGITAAPPDECSGYLICQNFEGTGYDHSETWTETVGTGGIIDEDDTTATVPRGAQDLKMYAGNSGQDSFVAVTWVDCAEVWVHYIFRLTASANGYSDILFYLQDNAGTATQCDLKFVQNTGHCHITVETGIIQTAGTYTLTDGTPYHLWLHYKAGSGGNGVAQLWIGTTSDRADATLDVDISTGSKTLSVGRIYFYDTSMRTFYTDQVMVKSSAFTTVNP